jgi:hypothetical protein
MFTPNFNPDQYLDADSFNLAASGVFNSAVSGLDATFSAGLVQAQTASFATSGLIVSATLPLTFGVLFSGGTMANAHGTTNGADSQIYVVNMAGFVPSSGAPVTAYLVATYIQIQQNAIAVTGPPPGHPDYNPNFVPYTGYQSNVDSLVVSGSLTPPNNTTSFELFRCTLASGATGIPLSAVNTSFQNIAAPVYGVPLIAQTASGVSLSGAAFNIVPVSGSYTLPLAELYNGQHIGIKNTASGTATITTSGTDLIYGTFSSPATGVTSIPLPQQSLVTLLGRNGSWDVDGGSAQGIGLTNGANSLAHGQCLLQFTNASTITLAAKNGNCILSGGKQYQISASGVTQGHTTVNINGVSGLNLANTTVYYVSYAGAFGILKFWTTSCSHAPDTTANNVGVEVITSGGVYLTNETLVGMVYTGASGQFQNSLQVGGLLSWFNRNTVITPTVGAQSGGTSSNTPVTISNAVTVTFLAWQEAIIATAIGYVYGGNVTDTISTALVLDGANIGQAIDVGVTVASSYAVMNISHTLAQNVGEGLHTLTLQGSVSTANGAQWAGLGVIAELEG